MCVCLCVCVTLCKPTRKVRGGITRTQKKYFTLYQSAFLFKCLALLVVPAKKCGGLNTDTEPILKSQLIKSSGVGAVKCFHFRTYLSSRQTVTVVWKSCTWEMYYQTKTCLSVSESSAREASDSFANSLKLLIHFSSCLMESEDGQLCPSPQEGTPKSPAASFLNRALQHLLSSTTLISLSMLLTSLLLLAILVSSVTLSGLAVGKIEQ